MDDKEILGHDAEDATRAVSKVTDRALDLVENGRENAANGLKKAAAQVRETTGQTSASLSEGGQKLSQTMNAAAGEGSSTLSENGQRLSNSMESAAGYLQEHPSREIVRDISRFAKAHPAKAILGLILGVFLLRRALG